jgi:hypothetical protein
MGGSDFGGVPYNRLDMKKLPSGEIIFLTNLARDSYYLNPNPYTYTNFFKLNENGQFLLNKQYKSSPGGETELYGLEKLNNGNTLVIANCKATISNNRTVAPRIGASPTNNNDIWVFELDAQDNIINEWAYGTTLGIKSDSKITTSIKNNHLIVFTSAFGSGLGCLT